ncbi:hypothetical protein [Streptomyces flaveus]|uniref:Uncharacterized protein n=1 Tax=Streptomyces flaveus TaxID=66370 RepID=A0A917R3E5_9ACTN|nr:hypothetical protein [Streptomyces flaveus]GGK85902.1 hypothetical protein GCM10010094_53930 [Streptomyces flaveus]
MGNLEEIAGELRAAHAEGKDARGLALLSREKLGAAFGVISFIASFRLAFSIPLPVLQRAQAWQGFGWGGAEISDEEFSVILSPWLAKQ